MSEQPQSKINIGSIITMIGAVLIGSLLTSTFYHDEVGPIESLKNRLALIMIVLGVVVFLDIMLIGVILYG